MPVIREQIAVHGAARVERVRADGDGPGWSAVHASEDWRCVLPGTGTVHFRNRHEFLFVDSLVAFLLDAGEPYQLQHESSRDHCVLCLRSEPPVAHPARAWLLHPRELFAIKQALACVRRGDASVEVVANGVRRTLARARRSCFAVEGSALLRARRHLAAAATQRMNIHELAEEAHCSPFHLTRVFGEQLGITPHQYRLHLRIAAAMDRLQQRNTGIADLAFELGFSSQSHFGDVMHRLVGHTPAQIRQALA